MKEPQANEKKKRIKINLEITKEENKLRFNTELASGAFQNGRRFRIIDIGNRFAVQVNGEKNEWTDFVFSKEVFFRELVQKIARVYPLKRRKK